MRSPDATANSVKQPKHVTYNRSISCHLLGNQLQPHVRATKSHSEANLAILAVDKRSPKYSPIKQLQNLEKRDSLGSLRSLNSFLSTCEGMDADYLVEDDSLFNIEPEEDDKRTLQVKPKLPQRHSMVSGMSVNSLLSLVEEDSHVHNTSTPADNPVICIKGPEDDAGEHEMENQTLIENGHLPNTESAVEKKRGGTGRTTSDERSQTGRVSRQKS